LAESFYALNDQINLRQAAKDDAAEELILSAKAKIIHMVSHEACYNYVNDVIFLPERNHFKGTVP